MHVLEIPRFSKIVTFFGLEESLEGAGSGRWGGGKSILRYGLKNKVTKIIGYFIIIIIIFIQ